MLHNEESHHSSHNLTKPNKRWKAQEVWPIKIFHTVESGFKAGRTSYIQVQIISKGQSGLGGEIRKGGYGRSDSEKSQLTLLINIITIGPQSSSQVRWKL